MLQGELPPARLALVESAFARLDRDHSGVVDIEDLRGVFNTKKHPEVLEGKKTEEQVLVEFISTMEGMCGDRDGKLTKEEFIAYYTELSASIPTDTYFVAMMEVSCCLLLPAVIIRRWRRFVCVRCERACMYDYHTYKHLHTSVLLVECMDDSCGCDSRR